MYHRNWDSAECYVHQDGDTIRIGNAQVERVLSLADSSVRTVALVNKRTGRRWTLDTRTEARLAFATTAERVEIPYWHYRPGTREAVLPAEDAGYRAGYHRPDHDDHAWRFVDCFTAVGETPRGDTDPVWPGYGWFRSPFRLPAGVADQPLTFVLGGYDNEDWQFYRVFVNGEEIGTREVQGLWREPAPFVLPPDHPAYPAIHFGEENLLAVQVGRLDKRLPSMIPAEMEHYMSRSRLVDQFITVGVPDRVVSEFRLRDWLAGGDREWRWAKFWMENKEAEVEVVFHYQVRAGEPIVRKKVEVRNRSLSPRLLLDVDVEDFRLDGATTGGGFGTPILLDDEAYCALEHPAAVNQGLGDAIRLRHFPGVTLAPRQGLLSKVALFGVTEPGKARAGFLEYLRKNGKRKDQWVSIYDPLGLVDTTNPKDPMFHYTEGIALDTVAMLADFRQRGITFDYYIIDLGWQDHASDLTWFRRDEFPRGPGALVQAVGEIGTKFGLWFSTNYGAWACGDYPPVQRCVVPRPRGQYDLCVAAEPYRTVLRDAALYHIRENNVRAFKFDMARFYCNSTEHGHLPGKYSVEAQMDSMVEIARAVYRACPDAFVIWYWGYKSPFWLLYGDTIQDKGLLMEAAAVASSPNPSFRAGTSHNLDQAAHYAEFLPLIAQDSLGIWIGNVDWANRMGKEDWREAWLLDLARGSLMSQLFGNLATFDDEDVTFLAEWYAFLQENWRLYLHTRPILGDPWQAEVYGYAAGDGAHTVITISNPGFSAARLVLRLDGSVGLQPTDRGFLVRQRYPTRGLLAPPGGERFAFGDTIELSLRPFGVVILEAGSGLDTSGWRSWNAPQVAESVRLTVEARDVAPDAVSLPIPQTSHSDISNYSLRAMAGVIPLPVTRAARSLAFVVRLAKDGAHWYHKEINDLIRFHAWSGDEELIPKKVPGHWGYNGPGSPWLLFALQVEPAHSGQPIRFESVALLPGEVTWQTEAWLYQP
ncbi:MAG: hypothetical protein IT330_04545 [Anaerolineae bacterium]|nr:hypothetical protein [Anaerolineae bacterium]